MPDFLLNTIEIAATLTGFLCVLLLIRQNTWSWPVVIISALLFGVVFQQAGLYANMGLQGVFIGLAIYGWYQWGGITKGKGVSVQKIKLPLAVLLGGISIVSTAILIAILTLVTGGSPLSFQSLTDFVSSEQARSIDAFATSMSLVATWMQAKKILENWLLWVVIDALLIGVFVSQGLYPTAVLYLLYLVMAVLGFLSWRRDLSAPETSHAK